MAKPLSPTVVILSLNFFLSASLIVILAEWTRRIFWIKSFRKTHQEIPKLTNPSPTLPKLSVLVPAKDEEKNIANCLYHLFKQNHPNFEIIVIDDRSGDRTPHLLENFKKISPVPFKIIRIEKLPQGWTGKNHAMFVGSKAASGQWLLFTDADTTHTPESISSALDAAIKQNIDFLTLAPQTECLSFWEKTVQPLAVSSLALWFDPEKINSDKNQEALANGQFILIRSEVYAKLGGNESVKNEVVEDVAFAKLARGKGFSVKFLNGTDLYSTRMYSSLSEIKTGWTRILTYLFKKNILEILHKIFLFLFFSIFPFVVLGTEKILFLVNSRHFHSNLFLLSLVTSAWIVLIRFIGNKMTKTNPWYAFLHPLGSLVMVWILLVCLTRVVFNRPSVWRGSYYR